MPKSKRSILNKFMIAKDELVSMKLHFRYHVYLYAKKDYTDNVECKYCQDRLINGNSKSIANGDEKAERG